MEEDYGKISNSIKILQYSLSFCKGSENLIIKLLRMMDKNEEDLPTIRKVLGSVLKDQKLEKSWKIFLEGASIEFRRGNKKTAESSKNIF